VTAKPKPVTAAQAKAAAPGVAAVVLGHVMAQALERGYQFVMVPAGDPLVWRELADRAADLLHTLEPATVRHAAELDAWRANYNAAVSAFTLQAPPEAKP
jgi:hypothetical protein